MIKSIRSENNENALAFNDSIDENALAFNDSIECYLYYFFKKLKL